MSQRGRPEMNVLTFYFVFDTNSQYKRKIIMLADWPSSYHSLNVIAASVFQLDKNLNQKVRSRILRP